MKKYLIIFLLAFIIPSIVFASGVTFGTSLSYGSSGSAVLQLQQFLVSQGCLSTTPTGYFGALTFSAVKCFQSKYDISSTGFFGALSRSEANAVVTGGTSGTYEIPSVATTTVGTESMTCPSGWACTQQSAQGVLSPANLSQGALAPAPLSPLVGGSVVGVSQSDITSAPVSPLAGYGNASVIIATSSNPIPLSPLVGGGVVSPGN